MSDDTKRPILVPLTSDSISMLGVALVTTAGFPWLFVLPIQPRGNISNPYIGVVVFIFLVGLILIALGFFFSPAAPSRGTIHNL